MAMLLLGCVVCLISPTLVIANDAGIDACVEWTSLAKELTGNGQRQVCSNTKTKECARLDCEGTWRITHRVLDTIDWKPFELDYCYGTELNPCNDPPSMDFFVKLPGKNVTWQHRVLHNDMVDARNLQVSFGSVVLLHASPVFFFVFEKNPNGTFKFSAVSKIRLTSLGHSRFIPQMETTLIDEYAIFPKPCSSLDNNTQKGEPDPGVCHAKKYNPTAAPAHSGSQKPPTPSPPSSQKPPVVVATPSPTLQKRCDLIRNPCSRREICKDGRLCMCGIEFHRNRKRDACIPNSYQDKPCARFIDCGINEICQHSEAKGRLTCQCKDGFKFNPEREICAVDVPEEAGGKGEIIQMLTVSPPLQHTTIARATTAMKTSIKPSSKPPSTTGEGGHGGDSDDKSEGHDSGDSDDKSEGHDSGDSDDKSEGHDSGDSDDKGEGHDSGDSDDKGEGHDSGDSDDKGQGHDSDDGDEKDEHEVETKTGNSKYIIIGSAISGGVFLIIVIIAGVAIYRCKRRVIRVSLYDGHEPLLHHTEDDDDMNMIM